MARYFRILLAIPVMRKFSVGELPEGDFPPDPGVRRQSASRNTGTLLKRSRSCRSQHSMPSGSGGDLRGHSLARTLQSRVLLDVIRGEDFAGQPGFRQHIDDAISPGKSRTH
jgi:hypothetical protein